MPIVLGGLLAAMTIAATPALADDPEREIQGIIQRGAGGSTDMVSRPGTPHAEAVPGQRVNLQNITGGVGAIGLARAERADAGGKTLLFGAENPLLCKVMGLGRKDYADLTPINVPARGIPIIATLPEAPFDTFAKLLAHIEKNPGALRFGATGPVVTAMINDKMSIDVTSVPYDGDGPALTALQGGAVDVRPALLGTAIEGIPAGNLEAIAVFDQEHVEQLPDAPAITESHPEFSGWPTSLLIFGLTGIRLFVKAVELPRTILLPVILALAILGAYAVDTSLTDVYRMLGLGVLGHFMRLHGYPLAPVILGVILSRLLDDKRRRAIISEREDFGEMWQASSPARCR